VSKRLGIILALIALVAAAGIGLVVTLTSNSRAATIGRVPAGQMQGAGSPATAAPRPPAPVTTPAPTTPPPTPPVTAPAPATVPPPPPVTPAPTTVAPPPPAPSSNGIPQGNGGDHDPDNNGGPSDGDGNL
jgi:hypothetical protein